MKTKLTTEQSKYLIELGVPRGFASGIYIVPKGKPIVSSGGVLNETPERYPIFKLTDLLKILPKEVEVATLNKYQDVIKARHRFTFEWLGYGYLVGYKEFAINLNLITRFIENELIDALYELTVWCIENGHLKLD